MHRFLAVPLFALLLAGPASTHAQPAVRVLGEMRRMFTAHDIRPNVDLIKINTHPHLFALGPLAGLQGEVTVLDGNIFVSKIKSGAESVTVDPHAKSVFLVYASVPAWNSIPLPSNVLTEADLSRYLEEHLPSQSRSALQVHTTARTAQYHIQNYRGSAAALTHEAHDAAKVLISLTNTPVDLIGFFTAREEDGGSFVHRGQKTHIHLVSRDRKHMGHLESIQLGPGAQLLLPEPTPR